MVKFQVEKCCCGCSLKLGVILIGVLNILASLVAISSLIQYNSNPQEAFDNADVISSADFFTVVITQLTGLPIAILLIWGARKNLPKLLYWGMILFLGVTVIQVLIYLQTFIRITISSSSKKGFIGLIISVLIGSFGGYFVVVIYSLRKELEGGATGTRTHDT